MFYAHDACCEQKQNDRKSFLGPVQLRFPRRSCAKLGLGLVRLHFGEVWDALGGYLASFGALLAGSWSLLAASWVSLGHFLATLGRLLANLKRLLGASWLPGPPRTSILTGLETCRTGFWTASGTCLGMPFAAPRAS